MTLKIFYSQSGTPTWIETHNLDKARAKMSNDEFEKHLEYMAIQIREQHKFRVSLSIELHHNKMKIKKVS